MNHYRALVLAASTSIVERSTFESLMDTLIKTVPVFKEEYSACLDTAREWDETLNDFDNTPDLDAKQELNAELESQEQEMLYDISQFLHKLLSHPVVKQLVATIKLKFFRELFTNWIASEIGKVSNFSFNPQEIK